MKIPDNVTMRTGSILTSHMHTLTNPINCKGVQGAGLALEFKKLFPALDYLYVQRCAEGKVLPGVPYVHKLIDRNILMFPTKDDWRDDSKIIYIIRGMELVSKSGTQLKSLALPALGCGLGKLLWEEVEPILLHYCGKMTIPIEIFSPRNAL